MADVSSANAAHQFEAHVSDRPQIDPKGKRFQVIEQSISCHCCFEATVVDTQRTYRPMTADGTLGVTDASHFVRVCETDDTASAQRIAELLNAHGIA